MAFRGRPSDFDDRYYDAPPPRRSRGEVDEVEIRERRRISRSPPRRQSVREYDEVRVRDREVESDRLRFLREDVRPPEAGALVLRQREVETRDVARRRSPSPVVRERIIRRARSLTPPHVHDRELETSRVRISERERVRSPSRVRTRIVERERSISPPPAELVRTRVVERRRSPSPIEHEHIRTRIVERERERIPSPSPSPPPPPPVIRGPTIEREVITHYRNIDHGTIRAPSPKPPPAPPKIVRRTEERETDIDIYTSRGKTEVDIHRSRSRHRSPSRERRSPHFHTTDDQLVVSSTRDSLRVEDRHSSRRRSHSAVPLRSPVTEEAEFITSKIDSRGRMGEAWNGATKDWAIIDVPPGTERVRMDGVGGGSAEVTWQRYNGVRRSKFIPERDGVVATTSKTTVEEIAPPRESRLSVSVYDREHEIDIEKTTDRRITVRPPAPSKRNEMWTEITKDLVLREAILELGYEYEETEYFFYVMQYLRYDDVLELVQLSDEIRRYRRERVREIRYEKEWRDDYHRHNHSHYDHHHHHHRPSFGKYDDERIVEREVLYDSTRGGRVYR